MKVTFFIPNLLPGGAESTLLTIINELVQRFPNDQIHLCISQKYQNQFDNIDSRIKVINFSKSKVIFCIGSLIKYFRKEIPDYYISSLDYANIVSSFAHKLSFVNTKLVLWEHSVTSIHSKSTISKFKIVRKYLIKYFYNRSYKVIAVSKGIARDLSQSFNISEKKLTVIYNPVNYDKVNKLSEINNTETTSLIQNGDYILAIGRLAKPKNIELLVRSFVDVEQDNKLKLYIMGSGPSRDNIKKLIKQMRMEKSIKLIGFHKNPYLILKNAKALVSSSNWEGFPLVLLEALSLGKEIISTDCPYGPSEILNNGEYGTLIPMNSPKHLAKAINTLMKKKSLHNPLELKKRAKYFSLDKSIESFIKIFNLKT